MTSDEITEFALQADAYADAMDIGGKNRIGLRDEYFAALVRNVALDEAIKVIEEYRIPVGNSVAGELACEWTRDALLDIRGTILALKVENLFNELPQI